MASAETDPRQLPVGELLKQLASETSTLVRQELELAKAEMREKGRKAGPGLGMIGGAGVVALLALGTLTAFVILVLDEIVEIGERETACRRGRLEAAEFRARRIEKALRDPSVDRVRAGV